MTFVLYFDVWKSKVGSGLTNECKDEKNENYYTLLKIKNLKIWKKIKFLKIINPFWNKV